MAIVVKNSDVKNKIGFGRTIDQFIKIFELKKDSIALIEIFDDETPDKIWRKPDGIKFVLTLPKEFSYQIAENAQFKLKDIKGVEFVEAHPYSPDSAKILIWKFNEDWC